jgi:hypothetical protein
MPLAARPGLRTHLDAVVATDLRRVKEENLTQIHVTREHLDRPPRIPVVRRRQQALTISSSSASDNGR